MTSYPFGAPIVVESSDNSQERQIVLPPKALAHTYSAQDPIELANSYGNHNGPSASGHATPSGHKLLSQAQVPDAAERSDPVNAGY